MTTAGLSSNEDRGLDCAHCKRDGNRRIPATGFCEDCCDFVCDTCLRYHRLYKSDHSVKAINEIPLEFYSEICDKHNDELVKFYCESCDNTACSICKHTHHFKCFPVVPLSKLEEKLEETKRTDLAAFISESNGKLHFIRSNVEQCLEFGDNIRQNVRTAVRKQREKLIRELNVLEAEVNNLDLPNKEMMETYLEDTIETENHISNANLASMGNAKFCFHRRAMKMIEKLERETKTIERATCIRGYSYVRSGKQRKRTTGTMTSEHYILIQLWYYILILLLGGLNLLRLIARCLANGVRLILLYDNEMCLTRLFGYMYCIVQKIGFFVSYLILLVYFVILLVLVGFQSVNTHTFIWYVPGLVFILILLSAFGIRITELENNGETDFGWLPSQKSFITLRQCARDKIRLLKQNKIRQTRK